MWECQGCGEKHEDSFEVCWNCGTSRTGEASMDFRVESEVPPGPSGRPCPNCGKGGGYSAWSEYRCAECGYDATFAAPVRARPCAEIGTVDPKTEKPLFARFFLPLSLVAAHALLVVLVACIMFGPGWDRDSPTILVGYAIRYLDYPVLALIDLIDHRIFKMTGSSFALVLIALVGSLYWFVLGCVLQWVIRRLKKRPR